MDALYDKMVDRYYDRIKKFIRYHLRRNSFINSDDLADDLTQDVFLLAWKKLDRLPLDHDDKYMTWWLFRLARDSIHLYKRTYRRKLKPLLNVDFENPFFDDEGGERIPLRVLEIQADPSPDAENYLQLSESFSEVVSAMTNLSPFQREVLILRYLHGFKFSEIAQQLGSTSDSVRVTSRHALIRLRDYFYITAASLSLT